MSFSYANALSGPSAGGIGWCDFTGFNLDAGSAASIFSGTLKDGTTVSFTIQNTNVSGPSFNFVPIATPTYPGAPFGTTNYTGISGLVSPYIQVNGVSTNALVITNIVVKDSFGTPIPNYTVVVSDTEATGIQEGWNFITNGSPWNLFTTIGNAISPALVGANTLNASIVGIPGSTNDLVLTTMNPTTLNLNCVISTGNPTNQGLAIGFAITKIQLSKNIGDRIDSNDQFELTIGGTPNDTFTTTGSANGVQPDTALVYATPGNTYAISEAMAAGSGSTLSEYSITTSVSNATPAGSIPPTGSFPINFTPALGDDVTYNILNAAPEFFIKSVDKTYADLGEVLTYTVRIQNPNSFSVTNVTLTDATPLGTTYIGNLNVNVPYTGANPASGLTLSSIAPNSEAVVSWQVQVNSAPPITSPVVNIANVVIPGGTSGTTNVVSTEVRHARIGITKAVDKAFANVGDILTYTLTLNNVGNVPANDVVIVDGVPAGTTYIAGSITGSVSFSGTPATSIALTAPIASGGSAVISFKVKVGNSVPATNPIPNDAIANYSYTVDPTDQDDKTATAYSNSVSTLISNANLTITKNTDKAISYIGDIITYQVAVKNTGNVSANNVVLTDVFPNGTSYVVGSLTSSVPYTSAPPASIIITNAINPGDVVSISFKVKVTAMPNPNPAQNYAIGSYQYTVNPSDENGVDATTTSNTVKTVVLRFNYQQQINDLIESVALQEAALAAIADAEGSKIQKFAAMENITTQELLCLNRSVNDTLESIAILNKILKQKLSVVECQIAPVCLL